MPRIFVKTLTGKTVNVAVDANDTITKVKARVKAAEGILSPDLQQAVSMIMKRNAVQSELSPERFVCVATGLELAADQQLQSRLKEGAQLKLIIRKRVDELDEKEMMKTAVLFNMAMEQVVKQVELPAGFFPAGVFSHISEADAHAALCVPPSLTETVHLSSGDYSFDIQIAWGDPIVDQNTQALNARGLVYEMHARD